MWHVWNTGEVPTGFQWGTLRKRDQLKDLCLDGSITLMWIFKKVERGGKESIDLAQDSDRRL